MKKTRENLGFSAVHLFWHRFLVAGMGFEPHDLRVMSPTSYRTALPRDISVTTLDYVYIIPQKYGFVNRETEISFIFPPTNGDKKTGTRSQ